MGRWGCCPVDCVCRFSCLFNTTGCAATEYRSIVNQDVIKKHAGGFDCSDRKLFLYKMWSLPPICHRLNLATGRDKIFVPGMYRQ